MFKVNNKDIRTTLMMSFWRAYHWFWIYFTSFSKVFIADLEWVSVFRDTNQKISQFLCTKFLEAYLGSTFRTRVLKRLCSFSANIYLFKVNNRNTRKRCEIYSNLTIKTPDLVFFIVNFAHILHLFLVFLSFPLN